MTPEEILEDALQAATRDAAPLPNDVSAAVEVLAGSSNRSGVRLTMSCVLAKAHDLNLDPRRPYVAIPGSGAFSGRRYDEDFVGPFVSKHALPCNRTTAFLTPAFRNIDHALEIGLEIVGRPIEMYEAVLTVLDAVAEGRATPHGVLTEILRRLVEIRDSQQGGIAALKEQIRLTRGGDALSAEAIAQLIGQHLSIPHSSRLPVLVVAAAYHAAQERLGERAVRLNAHNAADRQTGALGDVEVCLIDHEEVVTAYEMKDRPVSVDDLDAAIDKVGRDGLNVQNYLFVTTATIDPEVAAYAASLYRQTLVEFTILDCLGFLRHFLHLFHRLRMDYLDAYERLVLEQDDSAVSGALKQAFLALRLAAQTATE